jgi:hypothetical protein
MTYQNTERTRQFSRRFGDSLRELVDQRIALDAPNAQLEQAITAVEGLAARMDDLVIKNEDIADRAMIEALNKRIAVLESMLLANLITVPPQRGGD